MQKIRIRLPAAVTHLGPGLNSLGLALALYTSIEISARNDDALVVETFGEGAGRFAIGLRHPTVLAMARVFQRLEQAVSGFSVRIENSIPLNSGLGAETAFLLAGVIGANNLLGGVYQRSQIMEIAAQISRPESAVTAMLGGLSTSLLEGERLIYRTLPISSQRVVVILPELSRYTRSPLPDRIPAAAVLHNLSHLPLLLQALKEGDHRLLATTLPDAVSVPRLAAQIPGYSAMVTAVKANGASAVTLAGDGPACLIFCDEKQTDAITDAAINALYNEGVTARSWTVPIDTQGVVISMMTSSV
jgi:homoserine kinase